MSSRIKSGFSSSAIRIASNPDRRFRNIVIAGLFPSAKSTRH